MFHTEVNNFITCPDLYRAYKLYKECIKKIENSDDVFLSEESFTKIQDKIKYPGMFFDPEEKQDFIYYYMYIVHIASLDPKDRKKDPELMENAIYILNRVFSKYGYKN